MARGEPHRESDVIPAMTPALLALALNAPQNPVSLRNIPYVPGGGVRQQLDVDAPAAAKGAPVVVWIHGGGWQQGSKDNPGPKRTFFLQNGWVFVSMNYRLSPAVTHPGHVEDVAAALAFVHKEATKWGGDPSRMIVMGHSAGAHLAALVATDARRLARHNLPLSTLRGAILLDSAGYDMVFQARQAAANRTREANIYAQAFGSDPAGWADASPLHQAQNAKGRLPDMWMGVAENARKLANVRRFADAVKASGAQAEIMDVTATKTHASINREFGTEGDAVTESAFAFAQRVVGK